ncbi:MAG: YjbH domain-containing protein [Firmicutes bacterium]|nr:YjbH domain-containing protein [Bacillota bacterium]
MKRSILTVLLAGILLLGTAKASWGYGVFGKTDLTFTPTAKSLATGSLGVAINWSEGDLGYFNFDYGLLPDLEAGLVILTNPADNTVRFRAKYTILHEDYDSPALAIGVEDLGSDSNLSPYIVLSKSFPKSGFYGNIGVGGGNFNGIFGGLGVIFPGSSKRSGVRQTELFLEADSYGLNAGAKLGIGSNTRINFSMTNLEQWMAGVTFLIN